MNYLLGLVLGLLLLLAVYHWFNQNKQAAQSVPQEQAMPMVYHADRVTAPPTMEQEVAQPQAPEMDAGEASYGLKPVPGQAHHYPMDEQMGYPSGILPGKVGTFHPTKDCDRYLCAGCWTCSTGGPKSGCGCRTDDQQRNYPELIDRIREARTSEYPFYKLA